MNMAMCAIKIPCQTDAGSPTRPAFRLKQLAVTDTDRNYALAVHLTPMALAIFAPLVFTPVVLWLIRKDKSAFVDDHGREVINMLLTGLIFSLLTFTVIAIPFIITWVIVMVINMIRGAVAASNGEYFRYPMLIRFLS